MDKQLNISPYYFKPGFAYGGSCLPKDMKALKTMAHDLYLDVPVINAIESSNTMQIESVIRMIEKIGKTRIGVLGLSFKAGTDDMRNSPIVNVVEYFHGKGYDVKIYDKNISLSKLIGKNKSVIQDKLPHLNMMLCESLQTVVDGSDILLISTKEDEFKTIKVNDEQYVVDLVRIKELEHISNYIGICW